MKKRFLFFCFLTLCVSAVKSGNLINSCKLNLGIFAGANANVITGVKDMIVTNFEYSGYTMEDKYRFGFTGGMFLNWRPIQFFSMQPELSFSMQHGLTHYQDINDLQYDLFFNYNYLNVGLGFKVYPYSNLFIHIIPQVGFNLYPGNIKYSSNQNYVYGDDARTQNVLQASFKGRTSVSVGFGLGYQFLNRIYVEARYFLGVSDIIETLSNDFHYADTKNMTHNFQLTLGYTIFPVK